MDSSSDGSFAWTDDSQNSTDNEIMAKTDPSINRSGEESESGKSYKKKLQQKLFSGTGDDEPVSGSPPDPRPGKRKSSRRRSDADNSQSPEKKRVKTEPESDIDIPKKKKKKSSTGDLYDESFLDSKVKNEQGFAVPSPVKGKKKKRRGSGANDISTNDGDVEASEAQSLSDSKETPNGRITFEDSSTPGSGRADEDKYTVINAKKNKKKSIKKSDKSAGDHVQNCAEEDDLHVHETAVTEGHISTSADELSDEPGLARGPAEHGAGTNEKSKRKRDTVDDTRTRAGVRNSETLFTERKSRMSERIRFEEDDSDVQVKSNGTETSIKSTDNKKIINFLESSVGLRPFRAKLPSALVLTDDDDVWLVRCPGHVAPESFRDKKWSLDGKCKIKLDGRTYEGDVGDSGVVAVSGCDGDAAVITNVTINGCVRLRRKLPKAHVREDGVTVNVQTDFIPLPDTKCRHPLFGSNYKKAMKLPSAVAERLRAAGAAGAAGALGKSGKKRGREKAAEEGPRAACEAGHEAGGDEYLTRSMIITKKKKKRKRGDAEEQELAPRPGPGRERTERGLESADAWDSEKAIEENLFNF